MTENKSLDNTAWVSILSLLHRQHQKEYTSYSIKRRNIIHRITLTSLYMILSMFTVAKAKLEAVSYTHLTLPTIYSV